MTQIATPTLSLIAALDKNRIIGADNQIPWHLPADLKCFKQFTLHKPIIMGRKTFESIGCRPLPNRCNIVVSRQQLTLPEDVVLADSFDNAQRIATDHAAGLADEYKEIMIIGGSQVYHHFLPHAYRLYLSHVDTEITADNSVRFPSWEEHDWTIVSSQSYPQDNHNPHAFTLNIMEAI